MAEKHPESPSSLTMIVSAGIFMVGKFKDGKLFSPRIFSIIEDGAKYMMSPLPGNPSAIDVRVDIRYPIPWGERSIIGLYEKTTSPPPPLGTAPPIIEVVK